MEQKIREIIRKVSDIGEKLSRLLSERSPPSIETDIILGDIRTLYEQVRDLQNAAGLSEAVRGQEKAAGPAEGAAGKEKAADFSGATPGEKGIAVKDARQVPASPPPEKKAASAEKKTESAPAAKSPGPATLADKYKGDKKFINESLAGTRGKQDISSKIQSKPIQNIGSALGINDRFQLINDLFKGDKESFQKTIQILDGATNFNEAFHYITSSFDWDMEDDSVQMLLDLVRRKFIVNLNE